MSNQSVIVSYVKLTGNMLVFDKKIFEFVFKHFHFCIYMLCYSYKLCFIPYRFCCIIEGSGIVGLGVANILQGSWLERLAGLRDLTLLQGSR